MTGRALLAVSTAVLVLAAAGCERPAGFAAGNAGSAPQSPPGYRAAPELTGVARAADGTVTLRGRALPSARVRMVSPAGARIETTADGSGAWSAPIGPVSEPTLYRLVAETGGQRVEAEGLLAVLPGAPTVALLRAGAGAEVQDPGKPDLKILAIDFDSGGAAVVSGRAPPQSPVRVLVDGAPAIDGAAGANGRFSLTLPKPLAPGPRKVRVVSRAAAAEADVAVTPPAPPADGPYRATAGAAAWRLDWVTPGGGPQATLLFGPVPQG